MSKDRNALLQAAEKHKIPQIIVGYLKLQQANKADFFDLLLQKKINGRLFYNTCMPGAREIKYGNDDFLYDDFKHAIEELLAPFQSLSLEQVKAESVKPGDVTAKMYAVIAELMQSIETSKEWKYFWENEINLQSDKQGKKELYNLIAGAAAYKALVSCIDHSSNIESPLVKRNIAALVGLCTNHYESTALNDEIEFQIKRKDHDALGDFTVFKKQKTTMKKRHKKKKSTAQTQTAVMK